MIRKTSEMPSLLLRIIADVETEVVEYKAAKQNYGFEDIGRYFSALSNEANLRKAECGWLFFGISNDRKIKGTAYRKEPQSKCRPATPKARNRPIHQQRHDFRRDLRV